MNKLMLNVTVDIAVLIWVLVAIKYNMLGIADFYAWLIAKVIMF